MQYCRFSDHFSLVLIMYQNLPPFHKSSNTPDFFRFLTNLHNVSENCSIFKNHQYLAFLEFLPLINFCPCHSYRPISYHIFLPFMEFFLKQRIFKEFPAKYECKKLTEINYRPISNFQEYIYYHMKLPKIIFQNYCL